MNYKYKVINLDCPKCAEKVQKSVSKINGVKNVTVNLMTCSMKFESDVEIDEELVNTAVTNANPKFTAKKA